MSTAEQPPAQNGLEPDQTNPKPESESELVPDPEAKPEPAPELEAEPAPAPEPKIKPEPVLEPEAKPEPVTEAEVRPEPLPEHELVVADGGDPKVKEVIEASIQPHGQGAAHPELKKDEGSRTFTMRELLSGLKNDQSNEVANDSNSPYSYSEESPQEQHSEQNIAAMELINSVTGTDDDGRSRQRVLTFAAKRYASAIERNPHDYDALYNWALVLQAIVRMVLFYMGLEAQGVDFNPP
ncbi:hypothetical protein PS1_038762 [Malus domestica]